MEQKRSRTNKTHRYLRFATECFIYLYVLLMFLDKGEGFRNIGLYGSLACLIALALIYKEINLRPDRIQVTFFVFLASVVLTTFFSIEPGYSFRELSEDYLPGLLIFISISFFFNDRHISRMTWVFCIIGVLLFALGLHNYLTGEKVLFTSDNALLSAHKNRYASFLGFVFPFFIYSFLIAARTARIPWAISIIGLSVAMVLSASRGGIINIIAATSIWIAAYLKRIPKRALIFMVIACFLIVVISVAVLPDKSKRHLTKTSDLTSLNSRISIWVSALHAVSKRPLMGWGYGGKIVHSKIPYEDGSPLPSWLRAGGFHNSFIPILFQHGLIGFSAYMLLMLSTASVLLKLVQNKTAQQRMIAITLLSVFFGTFMVHALVKLIAFRYFSVIAALSSALWRQNSTPQK